METPAVIMGVITGATRVSIWFIHPLLQVEQNPPILSSNGFESQLIGGSVPEPISTLPTLPIIPSNAFFIQSPKRCSLLSVAVDGPQKKQMLLTGPPLLMPNRNPQASTGHNMWGYSG
jgi:hypothetical protein